MEKYLTVYRIWCEWDMGFADGYATEVLAQKAIDNTDWEGLTDSTLQEVQADGLVHIESIIIQGE